MTPVLLHLLAFIITALVGIISLMVICHMVRGYWRKAWVALNGGRAVPFASIPFYHRRHIRGAAR